MSDKQSILIQLDSDAHPSVFDRIVAVNGYTIADARDEHLVELALDAATGGGDIRLPMQFLQVYCQRARRLSWDEASDVMHRRFGNVFSVLADK